MENHKRKNYFKAFKKIPLRFIQISLTFWVPMLYKYLHETTHMKNIPFISVPKKGWRMKKIEEWKMLSFFITKKVVYHIRAFFYKNAHSTTKSRFFFLFSFESSWQSCIFHSWVSKHLISNWFHTRLQKYHFYHSSLFHTYSLCGMKQVKVEFFFFSYSTLLTSIFVQKNTVQELLT